MIDRVPPCRSARHDGASIAGRMSLTDKQTRDRIRDLNDAFRKTLNPALGRVMLTAGVNDLPSDVRARAIRGLQ
jgi:hypothetical protein